MSIDSYTAIVGYARDSVTGEIAEAPRLLEIVKSELAKDVAGMYWSGYANITFAESNQEEYFKWLFEACPGES